MNLRALVASLSDEEKKELIEIMSSVNDDSIVKDSDNSEVETIVQNKGSVSQDFTMKRNVELKNNKRRESVQSRGNTWSDNGSEAKGIETPEFQRTPRTRAAPRKKEVICNVCGSKSSVNSNLVYGEYYRCDRCVK